MSTTDAQKTSCRDGVAPLTRREAERVGSALLHPMTCLAPLAALLALSPALLQPAMADTVKKPAIDALAAMGKAKAPADFRAFLASAAAVEPALAPAAAAYTANAPLDGDNLVNIRPDARAL